MKLTQKQQTELVKKISRNFSTFGGGGKSKFNPLVNALSDRPPMFAAGVDVKSVVEFILKNI